MIVRQQQLRHNTACFIVVFELTKEGEVDKREVVEQQEPKEFACMQHTASAAAPPTKWLHF